MIDRVAIRDFRGVREGTLRGLRPLTVLTGPNGCGKSAVLDALLLSASSDPVAALDLVRHRHGRDGSGLTWLFHVGSAGGGIESAYDITFEWEMYQKRRCFRLNVMPSGAAWWDDAGKVGDELSRDRRFGLPTTLIDPGVPVDLVEAWSEVTQGGEQARNRIIEAVRVMVPEATGLELAVERGSPMLRMTYARRSVPLALAGDGVQAAVQLAVSLARIPAGGLALVEEPEAFQHPRTLWVTAKGIAETVRRGVQVVCTTHSLELIDALLASIEDAEQMAVANLALVDGVLESAVFAGPSLVSARDGGFQDLR